MGTITVVRKRTLLGNIIKLPLKVASLTLLTAGVAITGVVAIIASTAQVGSTTTTTEE